MAPDPTQFLKLVMYVAIKLYGGWLFSVLCKFERLVSTSLPGCRFHTSHFARRAAFTLKQTRCLHAVLSLGYHFSSFPLFSFISNKRQEGGCPEPPSKLKQNKNEFSAPHFFLQGQNLTWSIYSTWFSNGTIYVHCEKTWHGPWY